ncbi:MAG: hypothetical protein LUQ24_04855 [Methanobacterium sp.]|nr:hypothetical protein [Methanobacterium sp.]
MSKNSSIQNNHASLYNRKKKRGDRNDGWILKDLSSFTKLVPHLMTSRNGAAIYYKDKIDVTSFVEYVSRKNRELKNNPVQIEDGNIDKITYFNVFLAALVRLFTLKPHLNRFISGRKFYQRKRIEMAFVAKKEFTEDAEETIIKKSFRREETLWTIVDKLNKGIKTVKSGEADDASNILDTFAEFPGPVVQLSVKLLDFLNYIGKYPKSIYREDPMHSSAFVANLGSIGIRNVPYHHLFDRGTNSVFICLGEIHSDKVYNHETGEYEERYLVEISITIDERISDGFYYIGAIKLFTEILNNPEKLEKKLEHYPVDQ